MSLDPLSAPSLLPSFMPAIYLSSPLHCLSALSPQLLTITITYLQFNYCRVTALTSLPSPVLTPHSAVWSRYIHRNRETHFYVDISANLWLDSWPVTYPASVCVCLPSQHANDEEWVLLDLLSRLIVFISYLVPTLNALCAYKYLTYQ